MSEQQDNELEGDWQTTDPSTAMSGPDTDQKHGKKKKMKKTHLRRMAPRDRQEAAIQCRLLPLEASEPPLLEQDANIAATVQFEEIDLNTKVAPAGDSNQSTADRESGGSQESAEKGRCKEDQVSVFKNAVKFCQTTTDTITKIKEVELKRLLLGGRILRLEGTSATQVIWTASAKDRDRVAELLTGYEPNIRPAAVRKALPERIVEKKTGDRPTNGERVDAEEQNPNIAVVEISDLLAYLLTGEGKDFTTAVEDLLEKAEQDSRQAALREPIRTVLGHFDKDCGDREFGSAPSRSFRLSKIKKTDPPDQQQGETNKSFSLNLGCQNLLYVPRVQASVKLLRVPTQAARRNEVLKALADTPNEETLSSDTVEAIVSAAWLQLRFWTALDVGLNGLALACLCLVTYSCGFGVGIYGQPALWTLTVIHTKEAAEWFFQVAFLIIGYGTDLKILKEQDQTARKMISICGNEDMVGKFTFPSANPVPSLETFADLLFLGIGVLAIVPQIGLCSEQPKPKLEKVFLPWFCSMYWLRFMYSLRGERWLGPYLLPILTAVRDTVAFFFVTMMSIAAATHAYVILGPRGEDTYPVYSAFTHTIRLAMFGDFDLFEYQGQDPVYEQSVTNPMLWEPVDPEPTDLDPKTYLYLQGLFFCTGIFVQVLLLNLLVGILGTNYERQLDRHQVLFVQARARMLLEVQRRPWARLSDLWEWLQSPEQDESTASPDPDQRDQQTRDRFGDLHWMYWGCAQVAIFALLPLRLVLAPPLPTEDLPAAATLFRRFKTRTVQRPVVNHHSFAVVLALLSPVMFVLSLVLLVAFFAILLVALVLKCILGIQVHGIHYTLNLAVFGLFGKRWASECKILAFVRPVEKELEDKMDEVLNRLEKLQERLSATEAGGSSPEGPQS